MYKFRPSDGFRTTRVSRVSRGVCAYVCVPMCVRTNFVQLEPRATTLSNLFKLCCFVQADMLSEREQKIIKIIKRWMHTNE